MQIMNTTPIRFSYIVQLNFRTQVNQARIYYTSKSLRSGVRFGLSSQLKVKQYIFYWKALTWNENGGWQQ